MSDASGSNPQDPYGNPYGEQGDQYTQPYTGAPPTQNYPQQQQPGYQGGYQQYPQQYPQQYGYPPPNWGYPPPGYPYGYPPPMPIQTGPQRPGTTTTASILGYVAGGLLIFAAIILFTSSGFANDLGDAMGTDNSSIATELAADGIINLVAAGLLIAGSVMLSAGNSTGRLLYGIGNGIVIAAAIYWIARFNDYGGTIFFAMLFAALAVVGLSMAFTRASREFLVASAAPKHT